MNIDFLSTLYTIFIQPLQFAFEIIYSVANKLIGHPGFSIIALSLIMNFLVLPLYKRADEMQERQRDIEEKLKKGVNHIKKSFTGDERMMILQTYYRQNNYKPTDALNGSISLLLEIPFFIAAYQFLSHLSILEGVSLGPILNLGQPDAMFIIGGFTINVLPILMTLINVISSAIYLKGFPLKTKIQLYAMALFFLVFLYESPSGLVFYWTLNNLFSLCKNIFYKLKNPVKVLSYMSSISGIALLAYLLTGHIPESPRHLMFMIGIGCLLQLPLLLSLSKKKFNLSAVLKEKPNYKNLFISGLLIAVILGVFIPSSVISSSPEEFLSIHYYHNPIHYLIYTFSLSFGYFVVWVGVFYWISNDTFKLIFEKLLSVLSLIFIINYMFFGKELGNLLPNLSYEKTFAFAKSEMLLNLIVVCIAAVIILFLNSKFKKAFVSFLCILIMTISVITGLNVNTTLQAVEAYNDRIADIENDMPYFNLSKEGNNVIVLMLDRAMGSHVPYIFNEKPELLEQFEGFTYYNNVISHGGNTNHCAPAVFGGYEYVPTELNKRDQELLVTKHNEAIKVLPHLYDQNNYKVTVCDPVYANYYWFPDISIYEDYPNINAFITEGYFSDENMDYTVIKNNYRNFFCFSLMKSMPVMVQKTLYNMGNYHKLTVINASNTGVEEYGVQKYLSPTKAVGIAYNYMKNYYTMTNLNTMTKIADDSSNNFLMMTNNITHEPMMLQTPDYIPSVNVDNAEYYQENKNKYTLDGHTLKLESRDQVVQYHTSMSAFIQLGKWFDYMRENEVYDNTKIILVSDHGLDCDQIEALNIDSRDFSIERYFPLLMVKDFNDTTFEVSNEFMTNADVPTLAVKDTIESAKNPFTGKEITNSDKNNPQYVTRCTEGSTNVNNGYTFIPSEWAIVKDDMWKHENWSFIDEKTAFPE